MTIIDEIVANKKRELDIISGINPLKNLESLKYFSRKTISLSEFLLDKNKTGIIAEFKRKSPSKGIINANASVIEVTSGYCRDGASGLSVLTDTHFFGGSSADLISARESNNFPVLRKDFIIDEYQVIESKAIGADAILLIATVLTRHEILEFARLAHSLGLEVLLEIHEAEELIKINEYINIIGVNNRDLKTFNVDADTSLKIISRIPGEFIKISESGISSPVMINKLKNAGYHGCLIGEKFMLSDDPARAFSDFVKDIKLYDAKN
jgi:indole-3-glycerol phosphate synthase